MRDRQAIEREMVQARSDLEDSLVSLRRLLRDKVDVRARARVVAARGKARVQRRPVLSGAILVFAIGTIAALFFVRHRVKKNHARERTWQLGKRRFRLVTI